MTEAPHPTLFAPSSLLVLRSHAWPPDRNETAASLPDLIRQSMRRRSVFDESGDGEGFRRYQIERRRNRHCAHNAIRTSTVAIAIQNLE